MAVVVMDKSSLIFKEIDGNLSIDENTAVNWNHYFHIGSCAKLFLAVRAGKAVEEGKVDWATKFFNIFPEWKSVANEKYLNITLENLLACRGGIQSYTSGEEEYPEVDNKKEFGKYLIKQAPHPKKEKGGFSYLYSNASYTLASLMLEKVTATSYKKMIKELIEDRLKLSCKFGWPKSIGDNQPTGHFVENGQPDPASNYDYNLNSLTESAGDISMKPMDFAEYTQFYLRGISGQNEYIEKETYEHINYRYDGFSLGICNGTFKNHEILNIDGSAGTFYTRLMIFPALDLAYVILINSGSEKAVDALSEEVESNYLKSW